VVRCWPRTVEPRAQNLVTAKETKRGPKCQWKCFTPYFLRGFPASHNYITAPYSPIRPVGCTALTTPHILYEYIFRAGSLWRRQSQRFNTSTPPFLFSFSLTTCFGPYGPSSGEIHNQTHVVRRKLKGELTYWNFVAIDGVIKNQLDRCATGCNTQR
jgi:hypothetical protein